MPNITDILDLCCCEKCPTIKATIGNEIKNPLRSCLQVVRPHVTQA